MGNTPGDVAKALMDALPSLDHKKLLDEARRSVSIAVIGDAGQSDELIDLLKGAGPVPADSQLTIWCYGAGQNPVTSPGKTDLAIVIPATEEYLAVAREHFGGVSLLCVLTGSGEDGILSADTVRIAALDRDQVRGVVIPRLVDRLWERRLALARGLPLARDQVVARLTQRAVRDVKVLLGSVAGAAAGRTGAPTPATAQVLVHQAAVIVAIAAAYGADIEDKRALIGRVAPSLTPTLALDIAESQISRLAKELPGGDRRKHLYSTAAVVVARPALTASSTLLAALAARRVFRGEPEGPSRFARIAGRSRAAGSLAAGAVGHGAAAVAQSMAARFRRATRPVSASDTAADTEVIDAITRTEEVHDEQSN